MGPSALTLVAAEETGRTKPLPRTSVTDPSRYKRSVRPGRLLRCVWIAIGVLAHAGSVAAVPLFSGEILALNINNAGATTIVRIDPLNGSAQTLISPSTNLTSPAGLAVDLSKQIIVSHGGDTLVRIDPETGNVTALSQGGLLTGVGGLAVTQSGDILVADATNGVVRIDGAGVQHGLAALPGAFDLTLDPAGLILATDGSGGIFEIDPLVGVAVSLCAGGCLGVGPLSITTDASGNAFVVDALLQSVDSVHRATGVRTSISDLGFFIAPTGIAATASGALLISDSALVIGLDPGDLFPTQQLFSVNNLLLSPVAISVVPEPGLLVLMALVLLSLLASEIALPSASLRAVRLPNRSGRWARC